MTDVIALHPIDQQQAATWRLAKEVASAFDALPFVLIGGLMVQLLEAERGVVSGFATGDVDVVLDVRALTGATQRAAAALVDAGFEPEQYDDDLTYRFVRGDDVVDLLAPDHLGVRTSIVTVPPASTLPGARIPPSAQPSPDRPGRYRRWRVRPPSAVADRRHRHQGQGRGERGWASEPAEARARPGPTPGSRRRP